MKQNLRIAVFHNLPYGGGRRTVYEFNKGLSRRHTLELFIFSFAPEGKQDPAEFTSRTHRFTFRDIFLIRPFGFLNSCLNIINWLRLDRLYFQIASGINHGGYDLALVHGSFYHYAHNPGLLRYLRIPTLYYCQEPARAIYEQRLGKDKVIKNLESKIYFYLLFGAYFLSDLFVRLYDRSNIRQTRALVLTNSRYTQKYLHRIYGITARVNYLGADCGVFRPLDVPRENLVLSVGHLTFRKAHDFVIRAIGNIPAHKRPHLTIICPTMDSLEEKAYNDSYHKLTVELGVSLSIEVGLSDAELVRFYNRARITACAPIDEPFGLVAVESMACATPVVAVAEGALNETVINNQTGILTARDIGEFSQAMERLLGDEPLRNRMAVNGLRHVTENFTWEKSVDRLEQEIEGLLDKESNRHPVSSKMEQMHEYTFS